MSRRGTVIGSAVAVVLAAVLGIAAWADEESPEDELLARAEQIEAKVAELRGLKVKRPIKRGVMTKAEIRERLLERIADEYTDEELQREALAMKRLGLLPKDTDYKKLVVDILTDQIAGFYDPTTAELYIAGWSPAGGAAMQQDLVMAHEIDHALQDQHFNLETFMKLDKDNGDASVARQALVEGDGTALMIEFAVGDSNVSPWSNDAVVSMLEPTVSQSMASGALAQAPLIIQEGLMFPYLGGLKFVVHFRRHHPWSRIDKIYRKPPLSTEHILHPSKYESYERPDQVSVRSLPTLKGYEPIYSNVNGELGLSVLLRQHGVSSKRKSGHPSTVELATAGWGGDRMVLYAPKNHDGSLDSTIAVLYTVWDDSTDAVEFFESATDIAPDLAGPGARKLDTKGDIVTYQTRAGDQDTLERQNDAVLLIVGAPKDQADTLRADTWKRWRVKRR